MTRPISLKGPVDSADVRTATFKLIRRGGYDPQQVDPFLEIVAQTLEGGPHADQRIDGNYVHGVRFTTVRRGGYLPSQVDAFLDRVIDTFDELKEHNGSATPTNGQLTVVDEVALPAFEAVTPPVPPIPARYTADAVSLEDVAHEEPAATQATAVAEHPAPEPDFDTSNEADFDRLRILHTSGVLSDKEFAVLGARVRRRIANQDAATGVGA